MDRRIVAVFLPNLLCEIAEDSASSGCDPLQNQQTLSSSSSSPMLAVAEDSSATAILLAVNDAAARYGIRAGQSVAEARASASSLRIRTVRPEKIRDAQRRVAEVLMTFAPNVALELGHLPCFFDTVWVDVTASRSLWPDEVSLLSAITSRIRALGHRTRVAVSSGPVLARAVAANAIATETVVPSCDVARTIEHFSIEVLPLSRDLVAWFARLGIWTLRDLRKLPRHAAVSRLGEWADWVLDLAQGRDEVPLDTYRPEDTIEESVEWEQHVMATESLLFALRGLVTKLGARLEGRGQAARTLELSAPYDLGIAKLSCLTEARFSVRIDLASPIVHEQDLFRVCRSKIESCVLAAPVTGLTIAATSLVNAPAIQLEFGGDITVGTDPRALPILLNELSAQIGKDNIGILGIHQVHNPEGKSALLPFDGNGDRKSSSSLRRSNPHSFVACPLPSRLLSQPVRIPERPVRGGTMAIGRRVYSVGRVGSLVRFDGLFWWSDSPIARDYVRVSLRAERDVIEAWVFTDRITGQSYLHGYYD